MIPTREDMYKALVKRHGEELQEKISSVRVAVCGLGGLGSNIVISLARAGVGHIHIMDFDRVDISNLNRQQYSVEQVGLYKTIAMTENLKSVNPYCEVTADCIRLDENNISGLLRNDDIICEAFDNPESKAVLINAVLENFPEKYVVGGSGMAGLGSANTITTRRAMRNFYLCGDGVSDVADGMGLFSSRVLVCAGHQANMILRIIAGELNV
ncbi:MAG: sulfur carrier protein ThiS adenylyltransferase ThiF [Ruminococcus flavefaciens]|nr:sulfur carrier protein ThiS adenylyltransferase ThiF [Ruminococcus flavefaciens]